MKVKTLFLFPLLLLLPLSLLLAQQPPGACPPGQVQLASTCGDACVLCEGLEDYTFNNSLPDLGQAPPDFCAPQLHNTQWVGFVAGSTSITMDIDVFNCTNAGGEQGLQIGIYGTSDCASFNSVSNCEPSIPPGTATFNATGLTPGGIYFIVVDGNFGDICDFTVEVTSGSAEAPPVVGTPQIIPGVTPMCPGGIFPFEAVGVTGAGVYEWTMNGTPLDQFDSGISVQIPNNTGPFTLCVTPSNPCHPGTQTCQTFNIQDLPVEVLPLVSLCPGDDFTYEGHYISHDDVNLQNPYTDTETFSYMLPQGCTQDVEIPVLYNVNNTFEFSAETCQFDPVYIGDQAFYDTGLHGAVLETTNGCDSLVTLNLTAYPVYFIDDVQTLCAGESISIVDADGNTLTFDETGDYSYTMTTVQGCDSIIDLSLTVQEANQVTMLDEIICSGESYMVGDQSFTIGGMYEVDLVSVAGCDSMVVLNLGVYEGASTVDTMVCLGETVTVGGQSFSTSGTYDIAIPTSVGCDSIVTLNLNALAALRDTLEVSICTGNSYTLGSSTYTDAGQYEETFTSSIGCDSIVTLVLSVDDVLITDLTEEICEGESYQVGVQQFIDSGNYEVSFLTNDGCDSLVNLNLTVHPLLATELEQTICQGEIAMIDTTAYTSTGVYTEIFESSTGCDSTVTLNLIVVPIETTQLVETICQGEEFVISGAVFDSTGMYTRNLTSVVSGCDSIVHLDLTVLDVPETNLVSTICDGENFIVGGSIYNSTGMYTDTLTAANGCDSLVYTDLVVLDNSSTDIATELCEGEDITVGTMAYDATGFYRDTLISSNGCDSIVTLDLTVHETYTIDINASICQDGSYTVGNSIYNLAGNYTDTLMSVNGCDSVVNLMLTVTNFYETPIFAELCAGEQYIFGDAFYQESGVYTQTYVAQDGCDSIVTLTLEVLEVPVTDLMIEICQGESYFVGSSTYDSTGVYVDTLVAANSCDSIVNLDLTVLPTFETLLDIAVCDGESYDVGSSTYNTSGVYRDTLPAQNGCDSIIVLDLDVMQIDTTYLFEEICQEESYIVGDLVFSNSGDYSVTLQSPENGCDSIVLLNLTVHPLPETTLDIEICDGDVYEIGDSTYTEAGSYEYVTPSIATGCDSTIHLNLTVHTNYAITVSDVICDDTNYMVGDIEFNTTGTFIVPLETQYGCDSIITLHLVTHPCTLDGNFDEEPPICNGENSGVIGFAMTVGTPPYTYVWTNQATGQMGNGELLTNNSLVFIEGLTSGTYDIDVIDFYAIPFEFEVELEQPEELTIDVVPDTYGNFNVSCADSADGVLNVTPNGGTLPYNYIWSTGANVPQISGLSPQAYQVTVYDFNGCFEIEEVVLNAPNPISSVIETVDPLCYGETAGSIIVQETSGGVAPYVYAVDGEAPGVVSTFTNLETGIHQVMVEDDNGCEWVTDVEISEQQELLVDLGNDHQFIKLGETATIHVETSYPVDTIMINSNDVDYTCLDPNCYSIQMSPQETGSYTVTVVDANGCTASARVTVFVDTKHTIHVPNAFSPNGDGINDVLRIYTNNDAAMIRSFQIYDRWGEIVFEAHDYDAENPSGHWNGTHRGKELNTQVFVYKAEVEFIDGEVLMFSGDISLLK